MKVLFVCTGNTCRSPLAEVLCAGLKPDWEARSRGLAAYTGAAASGFAVKIAEERGRDLSGHEARIVQEEDMEWADAVYGMTRAHAFTLRAAYPAYAGKVRELPGGDLPDPIGGTPNDYRDCADRLEKDIGAL